MDLLDRYLAAVAALLPKTQREDIVAELRDTLLNQHGGEGGRAGSAPDRQGARGRAEGLRSSHRRGGPLRGHADADRARALSVLHVRGEGAAGGGGGGLGAPLDHLGDHRRSRSLPARWAASFRASLSTGFMTLIGAATIVGYGIERGWIPLGRLAGLEGRGPADPGRPRAGRQGRLYKGRPSGGSRPCWSYILGAVHPLVDGRWCPRPGRTRSTASRDVVLAAGADLDDAALAHPRPGVGAGRRRAWSTCSAPGWVRIAGGPGHRRRRGRAWR